MGPDSLLPILGFAGLGLTVACWLAIVFTGASAAARLSWLGALGLYTALLALFISLLLGAIDAGAWLRIGLFSLLVAMFGSGLLVAIWRTARALAGGPDPAGEDSGAH